MHKIVSRAYIALFACLALSVCLFTSACSDTDRDGGSTPQPKSATVQFNFNLETQVPQDATKYEFVGYVDEDMSEKSAHPYWYDDKTPEVATQTVILEDVPTDIVRFRINYLDEGGENVGGYDTEVLDLTDGETTIVTVGDPTPTPTPPTPTPPTPTSPTVVPLKITNAYSLDIPQAKYEVTYNSTAGEGKIAKGEVEYTVIDGVGSCNIALVAEGENIAVTSVKLSNSTNDIPFEWLDYSEPQEFTEEGLELDVTANEFTGGNGSEESPFLVSNPRQLDNVRKNCGKMVYYLQIRDIDFEGSCGLKVGISVNKAEQKIEYKTEVIDDTARFYNEGKGWVAIGAYGQTFIGSYNGGENTIDDLVIYDSNGYKMGLFGYGSDDCVFSNLTLGENCVVVGYGQIAALLGCYEDNDHKLTIENCHSKASVAGYIWIAELVGNASPNQCEFSNSTCSGVVYSVADSAGFVASLGIYLKPGMLKMSKCQYSGELYCMGNDEWNNALNAGFIARFSIYNNSTAQFTDCNCAGKLHCYSGADNEPPQVGGFIGFYDNLSWFDLQLSGNNTVNATFDFADCKASDMSVGGVIGELESPTKSKEDLRTALTPMKDKVTVDGLPTGKVCGLYSGNPQINEL